MHDYWVGLGQQIPCIETDIDLGFVLLALHEQRTIGSAENLACQGSICAGDYLKYDHSTRMNANVCSITTLLDHDQKSIIFLGYVITPDAADGASAEGLSLCPPASIGRQDYQVKPSQAVAAERLAPTNGAIVRHAVFAPPVLNPQDVFTPGVQSSASHWPCPPRPRCHRAGARMRRLRTPSAYLHGRNTPGRPSYVRCCSRTR